MTYPPPQPPLNPPPAQASSPRPGVCFAWVIIALCIAVIVYRQQAAGQAESARKTNLQTLQQTFLARYAVGTKALLASSPAGPSRQDSLRKLGDQIEQAAHAPPEQLRAAIVVAELSGPDAALPLLKRLDNAPASEPLRDDSRLLQRIYTSGPDALTAQQRQDLLQRYGWFGELALSYSRPSGDPLRQAVVHAGLRTLVIAFTVLIGGLALLVAGLVLLILAIVLLVSGKLHASYRPSSQPSGTFLEGFAVYLAGFLLASAAIRLLMVRPSLGYSWLLAPLIAVAATWPYFRGVPLAELRLGLGWHAGRGWLREIGAGVLGYLACVPLVAAGLLVSFLLARSVSSTPSHPIVNYLFGDSAQRLQVYLLACLWAPVTEELMFRGLLYHHLRSRWRWPVSALGVGIIFAIIHPQGWTALPVLATIGMVLCALREWRGSILASMTCHAINNFVAVTAVLLLLG